MGTIRRVPHNSHWGTYTILVDDNDIVGIEPFGLDPAPSPVIHSVADWATSSRRIKQPMVRSGWLEDREGNDRSRRGQEQFVPVEWDVALDLVAGEINRVRSTYGNESIFAGSYGWTSSGRFHHAPSLLKRMLNLVGGFTGHVDTYSTAAGPVILRHTLGTDVACNGHSTTLDNIAENTETLVIFGAMSPRLAQNEAGGLGRHTLEQHLRRMVERKIKIILVSPVKDDLPEWVDFEWWPIKPNTDTALMLALAGEVLKADRHDPDFLRRYCSGSELFIEYLAGRTDQIEKNAEWAENITSIDADKIRNLAQLLVSSRSMITVSWALQRAHHGEQPFWAALGLASMIGQIGLPGGGVGYGYGSLGGVGAPLGLGLSPAMSKLSSPINSFIPVARITDMLLNPGTEFDYEGKTYTYPQAKLVYWAGGNPYHHHQDLRRLEKGWKTLETVIVQEPMWTATAKRADIILPATTSIERNDIAGNKRSDLLLAMQQAIRPVGQARNDFDIFNALADRLGVAHAFNEGRDEMGWLRHLYDLSRDDNEQRLGFPMPDFDEFWRQGYAAVATKDDHIYLAEYRADPEANPLATESGKIVLGSRQLQQLGYDDCLAHPAWLQPAEWLGSVDAKRDGSLHLISRQPAGRLHSQLEQSAASLADKRNGREQASISPEDAARLQLEDGQTIRLWNDRGQCLATLRVSDEIRPSVVVLPTGAWLTPAHNDGLEISGNPNVLTRDIGTSRFGQGCAAHTCLVQIEAYLGTAPDAASEYDQALERLTG